MARLLGVEVKLEVPPELAILMLLGVILLVRFLFVAPYELYSEERTKCVKLESETSRPALRGAIQQIVSGRDDQGGQMRVYVNLEILNTGAPSVARGFQLYAESASGRFQFDLYALPGGTTLGSIVLRPSHSIVDKTYATPIPNGGGVRGWLCGKARDPEMFTEEIREGGFALEVRFHDVHDTLYSCSYRNPPGKGGDELKYYPDGGGPELAPR